MGKNEELIKVLLIEGSCMPYYRERVLMVVRNMEKRLEELNTDKALIIDDNDEIQKQLLDVARYEKKRREKAEQECQYLDSVIATMETKIDEIRKLISKNN